MPLSKKELIEQTQLLGVYPSKKLGQNFLLDGNLSRAIVADAAIEPESHVCEVGPGMGALTETIISSPAAHVTLIERDHRLAERLKELYQKPSKGRISLFCADAAQLDQRLLFGEKGPLTLIGNLPYNASTAIIEHWSTPSSPVNKMVLMLQREVADRLLATPGNSEYGLWTVLLQLGWRAKKLRSVPPDVFWPRPQVASTVVALERLPLDQIPRCNHQALKQLVTIGFSSRRKQLRSLFHEKIKEQGTAQLAPQQENQFTPPTWERLTQQLGVSTDIRGEALGIASWAALTEQLYPLPKATEPEYFDVVDQHDQVVEVLERQQAHATGLPHRAVHILLQNRDGEIFLQKRSPWKEHAPNCWCSSAAGHVRTRETYLEAAKRELQEELGVTNIALQKVAFLSASSATRNEFVTCFLGEAEGPFNLHPEEVAAGNFFSRKLITRWIENNPQELTPVFQLFWKSFFTQNIKDHE